MPARFILCGLWCGHSPLLGAFTVAPERGAVSVAGGVNAVFPTLALSVTAGVSSRLDLTLAYETHAGLAHVVRASARARLAERWAMVNAVSYGLFTVEDIGGIESVYAPFGNGLTTTHSAVFSRWSEGALHLAFAAGVTVRWVVPRQDAFGVTTLEAAPTLHTAHLDASVEWAARASGTWWLTFRALVPIQADFRLFGYLPMVLVGRSWSLP
jgi:hypothetical protein